MSLTPARARLSLRPRFRIRYALIALAAATAFGTLGFHLIEGWSLIDSLYMTVETVTTVGYGDVPPKTVRGRIFAIVFMFVGVGTVAYVLSSTVQRIVQSELIATFGERRRYREMSKLRNHYIICGAGRVGSHIIRDLERARAHYVVIEKDADRVAHLAERGTHVLVRDATLEETLREAGVEHARGLAACLPDDAENVYVVLTARGLNPNLHIVARAAEEQAESKLIRAGANRVVAPIIMGGRRMAMAMMKPAVDDFMDSITADSLDLNFEQVEVEAPSSLVGHHLRETPIRSELDVVIVSIRRRNGNRLFNPNAETVIEEGDMLIAIGRKESLVRLSELARGTDKFQVSSSKSQA
ncbi:MAG TPA: potassium channel protein [Pyrinomonadaceae bacterium]|jgi:voltage-gated potassium channel